MDTPAPAQLDMKEIMLPAECARTTSSVGQTNELITWIKQASYAELLHKWHHEDLSSPLFQGEVGDCFEQHLKQKRDELPEAEAQKIWDQSLK